MLRLPDASFSIGSEISRQYSRELEGLKKEVSPKEKYEQAIPRQD